MDAELCTLRRSSVQDQTQRIPHQNCRTAVNSCSLKPGVLVLGASRTRVDPKVEMRHPLEPRDVNSTSWSPLLGLFPEPCAVRGGDGNCQTNAFRIYTRSPIFNLRLKIPDHCRIDCEQSNLSLNMTSPLKKGTEGSKPPVTSVQDTWQCWKESSWLLNIDISN